MYFSSPVLNGYMQCTDGINTLYELLFVNCEVGRYLFSDVFFVDFSAWTSSAGSHWLTNRSELRQAYIATFVLGILRYYLVHMSECYFIHSSQVGPAFLLNLESWVVTLALRDCLNSSTGAAPLLTQVRQEPF